MERIRILHMIGSLNIGGSQTMMMNIYRNIDREKIQFDFVLDEPEELHFAEEIKRLGGKIYVMPKFKGYNVLEIIRAWDQFFDNHKEYKILHSHVRSYASIYLPVAKKHGVKTMIHSHSISNGKGLQSLVKIILQYPLRFIADYYFSCSKEAGLWLYGKKIVESKKHYIIKNAIDTSKYVFDSKIRNDVREKLNIGGKTAYIHVGRFHPSKNHIFLLNVFREIVNQQEDSVLILVGDGELRSDIEKKIDELELKEKVILLGNRDDVNLWLQGGDCFLFPSLWEGLGVVAIEAQAAGLPCVLSENIPPEVEVLDGCVFLPLGDSKIWAEAAMKSIGERKNTYKQIKQAGYDITSSIEWLSRFYKNIWE